MKNTNKLVCKIAGVICMLALFSCSKGTVAYAVADTAPENAEAAAEENAQAAPETDSQAAVVSSRTTDHDIYLYIKGVSDIASGTTVQIGNALCEDIQAAGVASTGIPIKTTILFDNSKSLSKNWGDQALELAAGLIDSHAEGEEFRIVTFADGLNVVADFSTDYESLKVAAGGIEFLDQQSYLTDILYDLLKQSSGSDANYMRFVIITDGADDNEIKYTQAELSELMKSSGVVIHTVGVKTSNNNTLLETLFSYARLTGGTYIIAESSTDVESVRSMIDEDYSLLCLKLVPDASIMDGSRKEAKLDLSTSGGTVTLIASLQMPFADVRDAGQNESAEAEESSDPEPAAEPEEKKEELPTIAVGAELESGSEAPKAEKSSAVPAILIGVVVLAVIAAGVVLFILKGKKKKQVDVVITGGGQVENSEPKAGSNTPEMREPEPSVQQNPPIKRGGNTARLGAQPSGGGAGAGKTMRLNGGSGQNEVRQCYISLTDLGDPQKSFRVPIDTRVVVGREEGDILLGYNAAASYRHCEILKKGNLFYVNDLKSSNGTFYGGMRVHSETPIMNGGILEVGKCKYKIGIEN